MLDIPAGTRLLMPSRNGSTLSCAVADMPVLAGCLRNASAVAAAARQLGPRTSVIAAGERWPDGSLRPALEDLLGAGAIMRGLSSDRSPESCCALAALSEAERDFLARL